MSKDLENKNEELESKVTAEEPVAEATAEEPAEVTAEEADMTAEEFDAKEAEAKPAKKEKKKFWKGWTKKGKIIFVSVITVVVILLGAIGGVVGWLFSGNFTLGVDKTKLGDWKAAQYYVGTVNDVDLAKMFPNGSNFTKDGVAIENNILKVNSIADFKLAFQEGEKTQTLNVKVIDDAVNVDTWEEIQAASKEAKVMVLQNAFIKVDDTKEARTTIELKNNFYGNGGKINVFHLVASRDNKDKIVYAGNGKKQGSPAFKVGFIADDAAQVVVKDLYVEGNDRDVEGDLKGLGKNATEVEKTAEKRGVKIYSNYGELFLVEGAMSDDKGRHTAKVKLEHCIFENGHKLVHIAVAGDVDIEGCIVRNASDTAISIGTNPRRKSVINLKNNVVANSYTGAILIYCANNWDGSYEVPNTWNELNVSGFLDIYNWKNHKGLSFLPETEAGAQIANQIASSVIPSDEYDDLKAKVGKNKYIHFAIIKIATAAPENKSTINGFESVGFTTVDKASNGKLTAFPIPSIASALINELNVWGYYGNDKGDVAPTAKITDNTKLFYELINGRDKYNKK